MTEGQAGEIEVFRGGSGLTFRYTPDQAKAWVAGLMEIRQAVLRKGVDYDVLPGGREQDVLLKPGAETLLMLAGLGFHMCQIPAEGHDGVTYRCSITATEPGAEFTCGQCGEKMNVVVKAQCEGYAGYEEDRYFQSAAMLEKKERANAEKYQRAANPLKWVEDYKAPLNTLMKMCLAPNTPLLVRSAEGEYLTEVTRLFGWFNRPHHPRVEVPGPDGEWVRVASIFRNGVQPVLRITLRDGVEHRVTAGHRFLTTRGLVAAEELHLGDTLVRRTIPLEGMKEPDPDLGWLIGLIIADGNVTKWGVRITLGQDEEHLARRAQYIGRRLGSPAHYEQRPDMKAWNVTLPGPAILGVVRQFTVGKTSYDKHLRATAWRSGSDFLDGVLRGWLDGDGSWTDRPGRRGFWRVGFTGQNNHWLRDLRTLGAILGYRVNVHTGSSKAGERFSGPSWETSSYPPTATVTTPTERTSWQLSLTARR